MDGGAWKAAVHGVAEGQTRLSDFTIPSAFKLIIDLIGLISTTLVSFFLTHCCLSFLFFLLFQLSVVLIKHFISSQHVL